MYCSIFFNGFVLGWLNII